ncbi:unnamed protein product [Mycena citricolor]|uniref:Uncharacterized protein n=1 Tax=Mycena citricolor TaxID=2018698 RepID=A0AAD2K370_9AGAR|nr:unnamed protein product [Mycena citricolor]
MITRNERNHLGTEKYSKLVLSVIVQKNSNISHCAASARRLTGRMFLISFRSMLCCFFFCHRLAAQARPLQHPGHVDGAKRPCIAPQSRENTGKRNSPCK